MTQQKRLKQLVRARMAKTGESYSTARRHITAQAAAAPTRSSPHFPGNIPAATALRVLLNAAGIRAPSGAPFSEAMSFGLAGGIGIGVFAFFYEKDNFASFYLGGRHLWHDFTAWFTEAAQRLGAGVVVREAAGARPAEKNLRELLAEHKVCVAWVDATLLPHRALSEEMGGSAYHVVTVYGIDDAHGTALIGDLTDEPIEIPLSTLSAARARIKKDRNRVLAIAESAKRIDLKDALSDALRACQNGLQGEGAPANARGNFSLGALQTWADRLQAASGKESWARVFAPPRLWRGLNSIYDCIEHSFGTGGGLMRPLFAEFLNEAGNLLKQQRLAQLAQRYNELGAQWSALADAALSLDVPMFRAARELYARKAKLSSAATPADTAELREIRARFQELEQKAAAKFPLSPADCARLRADLGARVRALYEAEIAAQNALLDGIILQS